MDTKPVGRTQSYVCALMKVHIMYSLQSNGHTRLTHIPVVNAGEEDRDGSTLCHSFRFNLFQDIREAFIQEKCSFLTLFKKPSTPPLLFEHYVVNFSEGVLTKVRKRHTL